MPAEVRCPIIVRRLVSTALYFQLISRLAFRLSENPDGQQPLAKQVFGGLR